MAFHQENQFFHLGPLGWPHPHGYNVMLSCYPARIFRKSAHSPIFPLLTWYFGIINATKHTLSLICLLTNTYPVVINYFRPLCRQIQ